MPREPSTPTASPWVSGTTPLALVVVAMGADILSASLTTSPPQCLISQPPNMKGLLLSSMNSTALSISSSEGSGRHLKRCSSGTQTSSLSPRVRTSVGRLIMAAPLLWYAFLTACIVRFIAWEGLATASWKKVKGANISISSISWRDSLPRKTWETCPARARTGALSVEASTSPVMRLVAPGPAIERQTPSSSVSFAYAEAMKAAVSSCLVRVKLISPSLFLRASTRGRMESPGIPKTCLTPRATSWATILSPTL